MPVSSQSLVDFVLLGPTNDRRQESLDSATKPGFHNLNRQDDQWFKAHGLLWIDRYGKDNV